MMIVTLILALLLVITLGGSLLAAMERNGKRPL
jgi:hypothetical protein